MGGFGSGGWNASGRATREETPTLPMKALRDANALAPGAYRTWHWSRGGREIASIGVRAEENAIRLIYTIGPMDSPPRTVDARVFLHWRSCRFGGARPFFLCPACGNLTLNLHLSRQRFACRTCARLTYATRRERGRDRHLRAANRLRRRLDGEPGVLSMLGKRPPHMRRRTYDRITAEIERREALATEELAAFVMKLGRRTEPRGGFWG